MKTTRRDFLCLSAMACAWLLTGCRQPTVEERAVSWQPQQGSSGPASESDLLMNAALDDDAVLQEGIRIPQNFELPLEGSTGFAGAAVMPLYEKPDETSAVLRRLAAGDMFCPPLYTKTPTQQHRFLRPAAKILRALRGKSCMTACSITNALSGMSM